ncbi:hypothetical protein HYY74_05435 [Candidatus Woesearchaeota archaeon]|nr:hypothetical protein [Candidatus Woesearchaeota archaeon]
MPYASVLNKEVFELAKRLPELMPEPFLALEEYDRTGRLRKWGTKTRANFTLSVDTLRSLRRHCGERGLKMSPFVEGLIRRELSRLS